MKTKPVIVVVLAVAILIVGILVSQLLGLWTTESTKEPAKFGGEDSFAGAYRADDIRGSYSFGEISQLYGIPLEYLGEAFGVKAEEREDFQCKDLETLFEDSEMEIGTGSVKMFVAFYLGQPYTFDDTYLPATAGQIIKEYGSPTKEQLNYLEDHLLGETTMTSQTSATTPSSQPTNDSNSPSASGKQGESKAAGGEAANKGTGSLADIVVKGSDYLTDLATQYDIPLEDLGKAFLLNDLEMKNFQVKDIKNKFQSSSAEMGTSAVKLFIVCYKGMAVDLSESSTVITSQGADIIIEKGTPLPEQITYLKEHSLEMN